MSPLARRDPARGAVSRAPDGVVEAEQTRLLLQNAVGIPANLINSGLVALIVWPLYPGWVIALWLGLVCMVSLTQAWLQYRYAHATNGARAATDWAGAFTLNLFIMGCLWGVSASVILMTRDPVDYNFMVFVLGGTMAGGVICNAANFPAMLAFVLPTILPTIAALAVRGGGVNIEMAAMLALFTGVLVSAGYRFNRSITDNVRLRFAQERLMARLRASEASMAETQRIAQVGGLELDAASNTITCSPETLRIFGVDPATFQPTLETLIALVHPDDRSAVGKAFAEFMRTGVADDIDYRMVMRDGAIKYLHSTGRATFDANACPTRLFSTVQDVTEREQGHVASAQLAAIVGSSDDAIVSETVAGTILSWNRGAESLYGYRADEAIGQDVRILVPEDRRDEMERNLVALNEGKAIAPFDTERLRKDGARVAVSIAVSLTHDVAQRVVGASFIARDITERLTTAAAIAYRARLRHAMAAGTGILVKAQSLDQGMPEALRVVGEAMRVDRAYVLQVRVGHAEPMMLPYFWEAADIQTPLKGIEVSPDEMQAVFANGVEPLTRGESVVGQLASSEGLVRAVYERIGTKSAILMPIFVNGVFWGALTADACAAKREWNPSEIDTLRTFADIGGALIQRNEAQHALKTSEARFRTVTLAARDAIVVIDSHNAVELWNPGAERMLGYTAAEAIGRPVIELVAPVSLPVFRDALASLVAAGPTATEGNTLEIVVRRKDGTDVTIELSFAGIRNGKSRGAVGILRDVTERKADEAKLVFVNTLLKSKMEASRNGVLVVSPDRKVVTFNRRFVDIWKLPTEHLSGVTVDELLALATRLVIDQKKFRDTANRLLSHPDQESMEEYPLADGRIINRDIRRLTAPDGAYLGRVVYFNDVTEERNAAAKLQFANLLLKTQMEASLDGTLVVDENKAIIAFNQRFATIWNIPKEDLVAGEDIAVLAKVTSAVKDSEPFRARVQYLYDHPGEDSHDEYETIDGRFIDRYTVTLYSPSGAYLGRVWFFRDITERRKADDKLAFANLLLKTQMEASLDGILIVDPNMKIIAFNQRFHEIWRMPTDMVVQGDSAPAVASVLSKVKDHAAFSAGVASIYAHPDEMRHDEFEMADGRCIERDAIPLVNANTHLGRAWFFRDVTERKQAEAFALKMARYDVLTGLANRAVFVDALQHEIAAAKRGDKRFALIYFDLDHFKDVNDTLGHPVGDELLKAVADRLRANTRETDTVARFGGDEFAIVVAGIRDAADAAFLADKLIAAFAVPFSIQGSDIHSAASFGIATYGSDATDAETLLSHADVALYRAKSDGRGSYRFFTDAMDAEVQTRVTLGAQLRVALDQGQLFLMYQPQVAIDTGLITGLEALVRWRHPERGVLAPDLFIPIAEQIGAIAKLGHWVLWEACRQGKAWLDAGLDPLRLAVNLSALQFRTPVALEADIAAALAQTGFPSVKLELELTETVLMDASRTHSDLLQRLRKTGVTLAIDDFGTGYSSLEYLRRFPSNRIKIAQNFVSNLESRPDDAAIIRATIGLARELNIAVIAEGVETHAQRQLLKEWGCGEVQGYLFSRPLAAEDATILLRDGRTLHPQVAAS